MNVLGGVRKPGTPAPAAKPFKLTDNESDLPGSRVAHDGVNMGRGNKEEI